MIVGHQKQFQFLEAAREGGRLSHAHIFSGPAKIGKKRFALDWLSQILGAALGEGTAYADFSFVAPLVDQKTGKLAEEITVDQIRGLIKKLSLTAAMGTYKAAIIDDAELMNGEAQNCLLKTLEEPPGDALIILITRNSQRLLETIRSRAEILQFNFATDKEMGKFVKVYIAENNIKIDEAEISEIVKLSFGRPGRLADFLRDPVGLKKWQAAAKEFAQIIAAELPEKFAYAKKITDSENPEMNLNEIMEIWQFHFRNLLLERLNVAGVQPPQINDDKMRGLDPRKAVPEKISGILKKIHELSVVLQTTNANPRLAVESFMLDL